MTAEGDLLFAQDRGQARAETAVYDHNEGSLSLSGRRPTLSARGDDRSGAHWSAAPSAEGGRTRPGDGGPWAAAVQADRIAAWQLAPDRVRVVARGGTEGWLYFPSQQGRLPRKR